MRSLALLLLIGAATATTYPAPPRTIAEQIEATDAAGVFTVSSTTTVVLDDGFPVTYAVFEAATLARGSAARFAVTLAGGVVDGQFNRGVPDGFQVQTGDRWIAMLDERSDLPGFYVVAFDPSTAMFKATETKDGTRLADPFGHFVTDLQCSAARTLVFDKSVDGEAATATSGDGYVVAAHPESVAMSWESATAAFVACGRS